MSPFAIQVGSFHQFSMMEIEKTFPQHKWKFDEFFSLARTPEEESGEILQKKFHELGGAIRLLKRIGDVKNVEEMAKMLWNKVEKEATEGKKMRVGISIFPEKTSKSAFSVVFSHLKKQSKQAKISLRIVNREGKNLDAGTLKREKLVVEGNMEICVFMGKHGIELFQTVAVQDTFAFIARDTKKPVRDMLIGMIPPKLARMLINFSRDEKGNLPRKIYDPFCGTGTVLLEATSLGCESVGSDSAKEMLEATHQNHKAFFPQKIELFQHDATKSFPEKVADSAIVAEGFLGKMFGTPISAFDFMKQKDVLFPLYKKFLEQIAARKISKIVFAFPFWKGKEKNFSFTNQLIAAAEKSGYAAEGPLQYRRADQVVGREVWIFTKK